MRSVTPFRWSDAVEAGLCIRLNQATAVPWVRHYFALMGRLGNGLIWYTILAALPLLLGPEVLPATLHVGVTALIGVMIYKSCKRLLVRERPFVTHPDIACIGTPLDRGSFPSGHTIHATCFCIMLGALYPPSLWIILPLSLSIAASRVILGHHYPTDVLAGSVIGTLLALGSLALMPLTTG